MSFEENSPMRVRWALAGLAYVVIALALYRQVFDLQFFADDFILLYEASQVHSPWDLLSVHYYGLINPTTNLFFFVGYHLWGLHWIGYHVAVFVMHVTTVALLALWVYRLSGRPESGIFAGLAFLMYAPHAESLSWLAAMREVLIGFWLMWSLWFFTRFREQGGRFTYLASLLCFAATVMSKESAFVLPLALWLVDRLLYPASYKLRQHLPFWAVTAAVALFDIVSIIIDRGRVGYGASKLHHAFFWPSMAQAPFVTFASFIVQPAYSHLCRLQSWTMLRPLIYLGGLMSYGAPLAWCWRRGARFVACFLLWIPVTYLPYAYFVPVAPATDRYTYLPSIGYAALVGCLAGWPRTAVGRACCWSGICALLLYHASHLSPRYQQENQPWVTASLPAIHEAVEKLGPLAAMYVYKPPGREYYTRYEMALLGGVPLDRVHDLYEVLAENTLRDGDVVLHYDQDLNRFRDITGVVRTRLRELANLGLVPLNPDARLKLARGNLFVMREWNLRDAADRSRWTCSGLQADPSEPIYHSRAAVGWLQSEPLPLQPLLLVAVQVEGRNLQPRGTTKLQLAWDADGALHTDAQHLLTTTFTKSAVTQTLTFFPPSRVNWWTRDASRRLYLLPSNTDAMVEIDKIRLLGVPGPPR